jgi:hypothetical protein
MIASPVRLLTQKHRQFVVDKFQIPFTLHRHSGMLLAGIHHKQRPKTWIPAQPVAGTT